MMGGRAASSIVALVAWGMSMATIVQAADEMAPAADGSAAAAAPAAGLLDQESLTGDWFGYRKRLEDAGIQLGGDEIVETLGNPIGGVRQGAVIDGRWEIFANLDLEKLFDWDGVLLHANAYQIHGRGLTGNDVGNLLTVSNIEADRSTRLFTLWLQKEFFAQALSVRAGQLAADDEFFVSQNATTFINSTFGWPAILGANLPSGGPAYPLATPGIRARVAVSPTVAVTGAIFSGDPADAGPGDPQQRDASGTDFRFDGGVFLIDEIAYAAPAGDTEGIPGTFKVGLWYHSARFADQRTDNRGLSLADPASSGMPSLHRGDYGAYVITDQMLWRDPRNSDQGLAGFLRLAGNPADRNLIEFHIDTGLSYKGLLPGRDSDTTGIAVSYSRISAVERALARDLSGFTNVGRPLPDFESALEATYQAQIAAWWIVQPDLQVIFHPGARLPDLTSARSTAWPNAVVVGVRTALIF
jgi:porin